MNEFPPFLPVLDDNVLKMVADGTSIKTEAGSKTAEIAKDGSFNLMPKPIFNAVMVMYRSYLLAMNELAGQQREETMDELSTLSSESMMTICHMIDVWMWNTFKSAAKAAGVVVEVLETTDEPAN